MSAQERLIRIALDHRAVDVDPSPEGDVIELREAVLLRAGRDNLRLHRIVEQVRALHVPNDGACDDGCCTVCDECDRSWPCDTKRAVDGAPDPRRIETAAELDALPVGAIVRDDSPGFMTEIGPTQHPARKGEPAAAWLVIRWTHNTEKAS